MCGKIDQELNEIIILHATYGKALHIAQSLEVAMAVHLAGSKSNLKDLTKTRYDEVLTSRIYQTFGQLKSQLFKKSILTSKIKDKLELAHKNRDWLAHSYWWDRSFEIAHSAGRLHMINELEEITIIFDELTDYFQKAEEAYLNELGVNLIDIFEEIKNIKVTPKPLYLKKPSKREKLIAGYFISGLPVFKLENNGYWTFCEHGLMFYKEELEASELKPINALESILPSEFNPKPKFRENWNYDLVLMSNYFISVRPYNKDGIKYSWKIVKKKK